MPLWLRSATSIHLENYNNEPSHSKKISMKNKLTGLIVLAFLLASCDNANKDS